MTERTAPVTTDAPPSAPAELRVAVLGARGRMGSEAVQAVRRTEGLQLVAELGRERLAELVHVHLFQPSFGFDQRVGHAQTFVRTEGKRDVLHAAHGVEQRRVLKDHRALLADGIEVLLTQARDFFTI